MASRESSIKTLQADASSRSLGASALNVSCRGLGCFPGNPLLLSVLSGLGRESMPLRNSDNCMHPIVQCIVIFVRRHPCRSQPKVPFCGHAP